MTPAETILAANLRAFGRRMPRKRQRARWLRRFMRGESMGSIARAEAISYIIVEDVLRVELQRDRQVTP